ncbi:MAG: dockerin type I domain-containing protein [Candidatus Latescibacteria bacterium]|nr:dockerin type I domain-containing protein [Candidatus Latescibacterota bacterium]
MTTGPPLHGAVRPSAPAFLRLKGSAADQQVAVSTDFEGRFRSLLIPVPRDFQPRLMLPKDFFAGVTLDRALSAAYVAGSPVRVSGAVSNPSTSRGYLEFVPRDSTKEAVEFPFDITDGRFTRLITFVESQAGTYDLRLYAGEKGSSLSFLGGFAPVSVSAAGPRLEVLPPNYFLGLRLAEPLLTSYGVGQAIRISGRATDGSVTRIGFSFVPRDTSHPEVAYYCPVFGRRFERIIVFAPSQAGDYDLYVYSEQDWSTWTFLGGFSPIQVAAIGSERVYLPVDYFTGVTLEAPLPILYAVGEPVQVSGTLPDPVMNLAGLWFIAGEDTIRFMMNVTNRHFSDTITFSAAQTGIYSVDFLTFSDDDSWYHGSYYPLEVTATPPEEIAGDANRDGTIGVRDASLVLRAAADLEALSPKQRANADVDQNNAINAQDAILILRFMAGLVDSLTKPAVTSALPVPSEHGIPRLEFLADHGMVMELSLSLPAGTAGGDVALTVGTRETRVVDLCVRGLGKNVLTAINTDKAGATRIAFAGARGQPHPTFLVLHILLPDSVRRQGLSIGLEGHLYNAEALPVVEIHTHQAFPMDLPAEYRLLQNHPNPFNPSTTIRYDLPAPRHTVLTIYNILGQAIRILVNDRMMAGRHAAVWDGKDARGRPVGAGIYVYRLTVDQGRFVSTRRMLLLK